MRRRKLPAEHAVWLVIGLVLFRNLPLWQVVQEMALTLDGKELPAPSASVQVHQRLGYEPMENLFALLASAWGRAHAVQAGELRVLAVDGLVSPGQCGQPPDVGQRQDAIWSSAMAHGARCVPAGH